MQPREQGKQGTNAGRRRRFAKASATRVADPGKKARYCHALKGRARLKHANRGLSEAADAAAYVTCLVTAQPTAARRTVG